MDVSNMTLVTGATGVLGNAIVKQLIEKGRSVRCLVRNVERAKLILPSSVELLQGDLNDKASIQKAMEGVKSVFHAAGIPEQWQKDLNIFERVNAEGTKKMIESALHANVERFVYTSTQDLFDLSLEGFDETTVASRQNSSHYEHSKYLAQDFIDNAVKEQGLPAISLHPAAIYGTCASSPTGLTAVIEKLRTNDIPMLLKGGLPVVFNEDAARAHLLAEEKSPLGEKYILTDEYYTLAEIAQKIADLRPEAKIPMMMPDSIGNFVAMLGEPLSKLMGSPPLITKAELANIRREGRPSSAKIRKELGWKTIPFEEGLKATIEALESLSSEVNE